MQQEGLPFTYVNQSRLLISLAIAMASFGLLLFLVTSPILPSSGIWELMVCVVPPFLVFLSLRSWFRRTGNMYFGEDEVQVQLSEQLIVLQAEAIRTYRISRYNGLGLTIYPTREGSVQLLANDWFCDVSQMQKVIEKWQAWATEREIERQEVWIKGEWRRFFLILLTISFIGVVGFFSLHGRLPWWVAFLGTSFLLSLYGAFWRDREG